MSALNAKPAILKQANLSMIRKVIKTYSTATRAEIVKETMISTTTVRSLLSEMLQAGEIECVGFDHSSGGRKAQRYQLKQDRYHCVAFCISDHKVVALLINIYGEIIESNDWISAEKDFQKSIISFMDEMIIHREIKAIGIGVPGAVDGGKYWRKSKQGELYSNNLGDAISEKYHIPVLLENDLNATAIGFGRCYGNQFPLISPLDMNMTYLYFEEDCISAGFIVGGKILRGSNNFAGELSLIPFHDNKPLYQCIKETSNDLEYTNLIIKIICWICGILNPQYTALGGPAFRSECVGPISDGLFGILPTHMLTEILYAPDIQHDYHSGMAYLTAEKIFDDISFVKE